MRTTKSKMAIAASLLIGAAGCELVAGLEDHQLVTDISDSATNDGATNEASTSTFTIADLPALTIEQGASSGVQVTVTRTGGFTDAINITVSGLPAGVTTNPLSITGALTSGTLTFVTSATTAQGTSHLSIDGVSADGKTSASAKMDLIVRGTPGSLDTSYGSQGFFTSTSLFENGAALDTKDDLLVSGVVGNPATSFGVMRILPTAAVDTAFGGGLITEGPCQATSTFPMIKQQASGKILAAGLITNLEAEYFGLTSTGGFDLTVSPDGGANGYEEDEPGLLILTAFATDTTGNFFVAGRGFSTHQTLFVERRMPTGAPDPTFVPVNMAFGTGDTQVRAIAAQPDGKIVTTSFITDTAGTGWGVHRFLTTGALDTAFGVNGYIAPTATTLYNPYAIVIQPDGKILVDGNNGTNSSVGRYLANGTLDNTFGTNGVAVVPNEAIMAIQSDGKIILGNTDVKTGDAGNYNLLYLERLTASGIPDTTFGNNGIAEAEFGSAAGGTSMHTILVQSDGRILVVGETNLSASTYEMSVARFWP